MCILKEAPLSPFSLSTMQFTFLSSDGNPGERNFTVEAAYGRYNCSVNTAQGMKLSASLRAPLVDSLGLVEIFLLL